MAAPMQLVGRVLGHYRVLEPLGAGGMGVVYRARDERLDRDVALKVLPPGLPADEGARQRFRHEALALARLSHPNIATIHDFDHQEGVDFLVMEYVRGTTLADRLRNGALPEKQTLAIGEQIARALKGAHEIGIVHRDLKPGNIMITPSGDVKLLDFGISLLLRAPSDAQTEPITSLKGAFGTLPYMSPEQLTGQAVDERCDIYTAGVVLHEMATGRRPFDCKLSTVLIADILHKRPALAQELSPQMSPALGAAILKCLEKDPDNRYQSAKELEVDLRRAGTASAPTAPVTWPVPSRRGRKLSISLIVLLAAISLLFGLTANRWRTRVPSGGTPARIRSLAVLPLQNLSNDASQEYFADGMTEELTTKLAQIAALRVISRTSAMQYKRSNKPLPEIARELRVDAVVEGSVMRAGDQVRITAQLIDAARDQYLWAADYEQPLKDVLRLQNQVAQAIVSQIKIKLTPQEQARLTSSPTVNSRALEAYLKGRFYLHQGTEEWLRQSRQEFARAVAIDGRYAAAYAGLADYYALTNELSPAVAMSKAKEYVLKALALDNNLAEAHSTLAMIRFYGDWDWPGAEEEFRRTIALNPSDAEAHRLYSDFLSEMGRHQEALVEIHKAQELDPLSLITGVTAGWAFYYARQYDRALDQCRKMLDLDAQSVSAHDCLGSAYLAKGAYAQAKAEYQTMLNTSGNDPLRLVSLGRVYALEGRRAEAERVLGQIGTASQRGYVPPSFLAMIYASMGDRNQAFTWLEKAYRERDSFLVRLKVEPAFDPLRPDPRFASLLQRIKLSP